MTQIGTLLKTWRTERGVSLSGLALKAGIGKATLSRWEAGQKLPRIAELEAVLDALGASTARRHEALVCLDAPRALHRLQELQEGVPMRGDLLRAMRMRRGRTQEEVAAEIGIARATLAKWESSEDWPSVERLHRLCYALQAQEGEIVTLTSAKSVPAPQATMEPTWEFCWQRIFQTVHAEQAPVLGDLIFHATEIDLWKAAGGDDVGSELLASVYAYHARWLTEFGRYSEAATFARRALSRADKKTLPQDDWLSAAIILAQSEARQGRLSEAIGLLRAYLPQATTASYQAWLGSELARMQINAGEDDTGLRLSRHVARLARDETPAVEFWFRRYDHAEILLRTGHPAQALEWLPIHQKDPVTRNLTAPLLLTVRTLLALGSVTEAQPYLQEAQAQADRYSLTYLHSEIETLSRQCRIAP